MTARLPRSIARTRAEYARRLDEAERVAPGVKKLALDVWTEVLGGDRAEALERVTRPVVWSYRGRVYESPVVSMCPLCGALAVVELPPAVVAEQPDDTTHVCHPLAGGCNHGFSTKPATQETDR